MNTPLSSPRPVSFLARLRPSPWAVFLLLVSIAPNRTYAAVTDVLGRYVGAWTNLTFGSTGKALIDISASTPTAATVLFDMDGFVFGAFNPPPITMPAVIAGDQFQIDNHGVGAFGDIKGTIDSTQGTFSVVLANIPGNFIAGITAEGTVANGHMQLEYIVHFPGAASPTNPARGVMDVRIPVPLEIQRVTPDGVKLLFEWSGPGGPYQLQSRPDLVGGIWTNIGATTTATSAQVDPIGARQFFRVIIP